MSTTFDCSPLSFLPCSGGHSGAERESKRDFSREREILFRETACRDLISAPSVTFLRLEVAGGEEGKAAESDYSIKEAL